MTISDLLFLASVLFVVICLAAMTRRLFQGRQDQARRLVFILGAYVACYAVVLISFSLFTPRRVFAPGQRQCFDDWCVTAVGIAPVGSSSASPCLPSSGSSFWLVDLEVSSAARRIRQRARDARATLEDQQGNRFEPCTQPHDVAAGISHALSDELGPGESFHVSIPYQLPAGATPLGVVIHHGDFPGIVIIGDDQSFLHKPALLRIPAELRHN